MTLRILFLFLIAQSGFSQQVIQFSTGSESQQNLLGKAEICLRESDDRALISIINEPFQVTEDSIIGEPYQVVWVRFALKNVSNEPIKKKLRLFDGWCEKVEIHSISPSDEVVWLYDRAGYMMPQDSIFSGYNNDEGFKPPHQITIRLAANETRLFYLKYSKLYRPFLEINLSLKSIEYAAEVEVQEAKGFWTTAAFVGMLAFFSAFYLLYFFIVKDIAYLYYALFGFSMVFGATVMDDYILFYYQLLYQQNTTLQPWIYMVSGSMSVVLYIQFTRTYLDSPKRYYYFDKFLLVVMAYGIITTLLVLANFYFNRRQFSQYLPFAAFMAVVGITYITQIVLILRKGNSSDMFLLVGISLLLACLLPSQLKEFFFPDEYYYKKPLFGTLSVLQLGTILEMLVFALGLSYRTKRLKQEKVQLETLDKLKTRFFTDISHELRTPLMLIKGPLQELQKRLLPEQGSELAQLAEQNADKLLAMISRILDLSKLEANKMEVNREIIDVVTLAKGIFFSFESLAKTKDIHLTYESEIAKLEMALDVEKIETVLTNLLTNAIKYTEPTGKITLQINQIGNEAKLSLTDTGIGIPENQLGKVFNRFYQKGEQGSSFGIGLALVKELILLHKGSLSVKSKEQEGSTFTILLPIITTGYDTFQENTPLSFPGKSIEKTEIDNIKEPSGNIAYHPDKHVLIVEDNADVRKFIKRQLANRYKVSTAEDGSEGIRKAKKIQPDLVISDVMMPKTDGYSLTHTLKNDILTSHIPIILLTAKAGQVSKNEGLSAGADAYLTKPYDFEELTLRIDNLIKLRQELRTRFAETVQIKPAEVSGNSVDTEFLEKLIAIVEQQMSNEDFSVDMLSDEIGMSSRNLNRKLQALLNTTPTDFIKSIRLQRAADLLSQNTGTIAEIAFQTGFRSAAYFSSSFKKHFGISPKNYTQQT